MIIEDITRLILKLADAAAGVWPTHIVVTAAQYDALMEQIILDALIRDRDIQTRNGYVLFLNVEIARP